jgi:hypothetical protein
MDVEPHTSTPTPTPTRKSSGYRRLQGRHKELIAIHENLQAEHDALREDVERLLEQHKRLLGAVKSGPSWPDLANNTLSTLEAAPDPRGLQAVAASLAQLQSRLAQIVARAGVNP